ncbi:putative MFS family arabinose efflux permease [Tumebacillus sp. BK434]|uniref:MDR family MFS transporter n=1 Tax=Tumebacillus sp. BK434 TaxID=2512169 RepID=UPI00104F651C|nr:MFS transporter [Tumebacillus sp. BK434]TCP55410.1 putative MFS family arabinose efflux permease [Tumebacillus sp. BK434]
MHRLRSYFQAYHPIVHSILFGTCMARLASGMSMPFLALYLARELELSPALIGLTIGLGMFCEMIGGFIGGTLSDRFGRQRIMMTALYLWTLVFTCYAFATELWMFLLLTALQGLSRAFYEPVGQALLSDLTTPEQRYRVFTLRYTFNNLGWAIGPIIGALLGMSAGAGAFLITGGVYLVFALIMQGMFSRFAITKLQGAGKEVVTFRKAAATVWGDKALLLFILGSIMGTLCYSQITTNLSQHVGGLAGGVTLFGVLLTVNASVVVLLQLPLSSWAEKRTPLQTIWIGNLFYAAGFAGFAYADSWTGMILSMAVFTIGEVLCFPAGSVLLDRLAPDGMRGTYFGTQSFKYLGTSIGPWLGGVVLVGSGAEALFLGTALVAQIGTLFYWLGQRRAGQLLVSPTPKTPSL